MLSIMPKELSGKIKYWNNEVYIKDGVKLTSDEQKIFNDYRNWLRQAQEDRFK